MKIREIDSPENPLNLALARFESQFAYPLGNGRSFRISHGDDYTRFYRSIGDAVCFVAEERGEILGTISSAIRPLLFPDRNVHAVLYLGDVKVARGVPGRTLLSLCDAMNQWAKTRTRFAYGIVMDGTRATPVRYTGRLGIPAFHEIAKIVVLRFEVGDALDFRNDSPHVELTTGDAVNDRFIRFSAGRFAGLSEDPQLRSEMAPVFLIDSHGAACGRLEDTRQAKRLWGYDGQELSSAHLSSFAYENPAAGLRLVEAALDRAVGHGFPALFVSVPAPDAQYFASAVAYKVTAAPATVYGFNLEPGGFWNVNTAEI